MKYDIKWEDNSRVRRNPKISKEDIVGKNTRRTNKNYATVKMKNISGAYPLANVYFNGESSFHKNTDKAKTEYPNLIVHINTDPQKKVIEFSSSTSPQKLLEVMKVIDKVMETI